MTMQHMVRGFTLILLLSGCVRTSGSPPSEGPRLGIQEVEGDNDRDGFLNLNDACPREPGVEPDGCPIADLDGDGILDADDQCATEAETRNDYVDEDGCPDEVPPDLAEFTGVIRLIQFEPEREILTRDSERVLERAAQVFQRHPMVRVEVSSHLDTSAPREHGRNLSARRADVIKQFLVRQGIAPRRIETRGAGVDEPIDTHETAYGRARNQRIEFVIMGP